jgi:hypothetical protein
VVLQFLRDGADLSERQSRWNASGLEAYLIGLLASPLHFLRRTYSLSTLRSMLIPQSYLLFEVPSNMLLARSKPAIFLPSIMVTWGAVSIIVAAIHNLAGMVAFRFALGIIEAGFFPGVVSAMTFFRRFC